MDLVKLLGKTSREAWRDVWKNMEEPSKQNLQSSVEAVKQRFPAVQRALKDVEHTFKNNWTALTESVAEGETPVNAERLVNTLLPLPERQQVQPDKLEDLVLIQRGGFGDIFRGRSTTWGLPIALKIIRGAERDTVKELKKEAKMMQLANFPYVLRLLGLYQKQEGECMEYGLVMEYMPNGSLFSLFKNVTPVPWPLRFQIIHQVALGMNYLHSLDPPLLHLDLKPKNVLLDHSLIVRLTDFGLSKLKCITSSSMAVGIGGTWPYMPPEALTDLNYVPREPFDVYSYGILTWSVLAAEEPYQYVSPEQIRWHVPEGQRPNEKQLESLDSITMVPEAKTLMRRCWDRDPEARPPFSACIKITQEMFDVYEAEIDHDIRSVQDHLKQQSSEETENTDSATASLETSTLPLTTDALHPSFFVTE